MFGTAKFERKLLFLVIVYIIFRMAMIFENVHTQIAGLFIQCTVAEIVL